MRHFQLQSHTRVPLLPARQREICTATLARVRAYAHFRPGPLRLRVPNPMLLRDPNPMRLRTLNPDPKTLMSNPFKSNA